MNLKLICLLSAAALFLGCAQDFPSTTTTPYPPHTYNPLVTHIPLGGDPRQNSDVFDTDKVLDKATLPELNDLPAVPIANRTGPPKKYTGIIKNKTAYEVSVPSKNSGAALIIPARGWIEYVAFEPHFSLTAYHNGKPFYCMNINTDPKNYAFMCDKYDFMVEIVKPEPKSKANRKMKKRVRKKPKVDEEC